MFNLDALENNSIIFAKNNEKNQILRYLSENSLFLNIHFFNEHLEKYTINRNYLSYMKSHFKKPYALANKIRECFSYIDLNKSYSTDKLNNIKDIFKNLIDNNLIEEKTSFNKVSNFYNVNYFLIPSFIKAPNQIPLYTYTKEPSSIVLYKVKNQLEQSFFIYEKTIELLENNVDINDIVILNSSLEDDYYLEKLFFDANIPITFNKAKKVIDIPYVIDFVKYIKNHTFDEITSFFQDNILTKTSESKIIKKIVSVFNSFYKKDLINNPGLLIHELEKLTFKSDKYINTVNVYTINDFEYESKNHYLLMNYTDNYLPKRSIDNDYLTDTEKQEIGMYTRQEINSYNRKHIELIIESIKNLMLIFPETLEDKMRLPELTITRDINTFDYIYETKERTYFNTFDKYLLSVKKYDLDTYYKESPDYDLLYSNFDIEKYDPQFKGISNKSLESLIKASNSITGAKIESINLCPYQFFLKYFLKIEEYNESLARYLGELSHKVLEMNIVNPSKTLDEIIYEVEGFPEEISYKKEIFLEAIKEELMVLLDTVNTFHSQTKFKTIKLEEYFDIPVNDQSSMRIVGRIDKVMIKETENKNYFVILDYKLGDKDFKLDLFEKGRALQMPFYVYGYLKKNSGQDYRPVGFYYQTTTLGRVKLSDAEDINNFKLKGISLNDKAQITDLNQDLSHLAGIALTKQGEFRKSNRLIDKLEMEALIKKTEEYTLKAIKMIESGDFVINPIVIEGANKDSVSCEYCQFEAICYLKNKKVGVDLDEED